MSAFNPKEFLAKYSSLNTEGSVPIDMTDTGIPGGPADMVSATSGKPTPQSRYQQDMIDLNREKSRANPTREQLIAYADADRLLAGRANGEGGAPFREDNMGVSKFDPKAFLAKYSTAPAQPAPAPVTPAASAATPAPTPEASWWNVIGSAPNKAIAGVADTFLNAPRNLVNLGKMAYGAGATALGYPGAAPEVTAPENSTHNAMVRLGLITPTNNMTTGQRIVDTGLQAATTGLLNPSSTVRNALSNVVKGGIGGTVGQAVTEATDNPVAGLIAGIATPAALESRALAAQTAARTNQAKNAVRDQTLKDAQSVGYLVTPGSVTPSGPRIALEQIAGKSRLEQELSVKNQQVTDALARKAVGLPENTPLTTPAMKAIRAEEYQKGYVPVAQIGVIPTDAVFKQELMDIAGKFTGASRSFPNAMPSEVKRMVASIRVGQFDSADAIQMSQALRDAATGSFRKGDTGLGKAQIAASKAIEDQIERSLAGANNPNAGAILNQFRESRKRMAVSHAVEDAIHEGSGSVDASKLAADLQKGKLLTNELETAAKFANVFKNVNKSPSQIGTPGATSLFGTGLGSTVGAGAGVLMGGPIGGVAGAAAMPTASWLARSYLQSGRAQKNALAPYKVDPLMAQLPVDQNLRNALIGVPLAY